MVSAHLLICFLACSALKMFPHWAWPFRRVLYLAPHWRQNIPERYKMRDFAGLGIWYFHSEPCFASISFNLIEIVSTFLSPTEEQTKQCPHWWPTGEPHLKHCHLYEMLPLSGWRQSVLKVGAVVSWYFGLARTSLDPQSWSDDTRLGPNVQ